MGAVQRRCLQTSDVPEVLGKPEVNRKKAISSRIIYKVRVKSFLQGDSLTADSMVMSDFKSAHAFPVKPEIVGFRRFKSQSEIFSYPYLPKQTCLVQKWMWFFGPPTHFRFKPEIIGFIPSKALRWIFFDLYLRKRTGWVQKWMLFFGAPTHFRFKPEIVGFRRFKSQT